jgi:uncharacterized SAM-binding protein YcdF (DUF218 family)
MFRFSSGADLYTERGQTLWVKTFMAWLSYSSLIPPNLFILLTAIGLVLAWRWTRLGLVVATLGGVLLYLASTPVVADYLIGYVKDLATEVPVLPSNAPPGAIIVLSADYRRSDTPGQAYTAGPLTLERLAAAAREERRLGLPVLVSGGQPGDIDESLASIMSTVLQEDFRVPARWREDRSLNTFENALFSAEILRRAGVPSALLITHCRDMARALWSFYAAGYPVTPAICSRQQATGQRRNEDQAQSLSVSSFFPQVPSLLVSYRALHELIGLWWYRYHYRDGDVGLAGSIRPQGK